MKLTATQYAKTLYEITKEKNPSEIDEAVSGFLQLLVRNNQIRLVDGIISRFKEISNTKEGITEAEITSREKLDSEVENKLSEFIKEKYQAKKVVIDNKIDEKILGGIKIKIGDEMMDGSVQNTLVKLKQNLINNF